MRGLTPCRPLERAMRASSCAAVEEVAALGGLQSEADLLVGDDLGVVEEGAGDGGHGDGVLGAAVLGVDFAHAMEADAWAGGAASGGDGDVDGAAGGGTQVPQGQGGAVAQDGFGSAGEDGGQPAGLGSEVAVADRVNAAIETVQACRQAEAVDARGREPQFAQLRLADDAVLAARESREGLVSTWMTLFPHTGNRVIQGPVFTPLTPQSPRWDTSDAARTPGNPAAARNTSAARAATG